MKNKKMDHSPLLSLSFFFFFFFTTPLYSSPTLEDHFIKSIPPSSSLHQNLSQQYIELTHPLPSDHLTPACSHLVFHHDFANTVGQPPTSVPYSPPSNCAWSHAVLEFSAACKGEQYDRIVGVWIDGAEILRTSTAEPNDDGVFWRVRKDVTRYSSLLVLSNLTLTVMLENVVNDEYTGVYHVNISLFYYKDNGVTVPLSRPADQQKLNRKLGLGFVTDHEIESKLGFESEEFVKKSKIENKSGIDNQINSLNLYESPADLIIPISGIRDEGFWFRIPNGSIVNSKGIEIPRNTWKAVLEVYVSFHGDDEFWYSNPPDSYIMMNNLTTGRGHGAYREVFVTIDGKFVGSVIPFPVIFTGGINPLFWEPVVAIGAFEVPAYDFNLTPFLGLLLDGEVHFFGLGVADSIQFWLVDANLHIWLDHGSLEVQAKSVDYHAPFLSIGRNSVFKQLDGLFRIVAKRKSRFAGWVNSTAGNITTHVLQDFKVKNVIRFDKNGTQKSVKQRVKTKTEVRVISDTGKLINRAIVKRKYPLTITTATLPGQENDINLMLTSVLHGLKEKTSNGYLLSSVYNKQNSSGWMVVKDHNVLSGAAETHQFYKYRDELACYSRVIEAANGRIINDDTRFPCAPTF